MLPPPGAATTEHHELGSFNREGIRSSAGEHLAAVSKSPASGGPGLLAERRQPLPCLPCPRGALTGRQSLDQGSRPLQHALILTRHTGSDPLLTNSETARGQDFRIPFWAVTVQPVTEVFQ